jgi:hypothetical protein
MNGDGIKQRRPQGDPRRRNVLRFIGLEIFVEPDVYLRRVHKFF